jgi:predicted nucleotide-binding protein (sugar kinase/HSP70/actin superfamily)
MKPIYKIILVSLIIVSYYQNKSINELKESANKIENINIILPKSSFGELEQIQKNHRAMVIAIAMTESNSSYSVKHPASDTVGIGGIKPSVWDLQ